MRLICLASFCGGLWLYLATGQTSAPPPPQSARQALLEMFLGTGENKLPSTCPRPPAKR